MDLKDYDTVIRGVRVVAVVAMSSFPFWRERLEALKSVCDEIYVRFDGVQGDPEMLRELQAAAGDKLKHVRVSDEPWKPPMWREDGLRLLDDVKPDIVLCPDEDEEFGDGFLAELRTFWQSDKLGMMLEYEPLVTHDGKIINDGAPYPPEPHMKAYKWRAGLSYWPWHRGGGVMSQYFNPSCQWRAKTRLRHYCCYTPGLLAMKKWRSDRPQARAQKSVTLLGFGPSSKTDKPVAGEIWTLNNCYEVFAANTMRYVTRIYEMHGFGPRTEREMWDAGSGEFVRRSPPDRNAMRARDGRTHVWHLDALGRMGHRVVMQQPHPRITNSETYPLDLIAAQLGATFFTGSGAYMVAQAIAEGYSHIRVYGFDQMDYEHLLQRYSMIWWLGYAAGRGIRVDGALTFMEVFGKRRYGYDYGPEWDKQCNEDLWRGFPMRVEFKQVSPSIAGDMHGHRR